MKIEDIQVLERKLAKAHQLQKHIDSIKTRINRINADMSYPPGDKVLIARQRQSEIPYTQVYEYDPSDQEIIKLGEWMIEQLKIKLGQLEKEFEEL